MKNDAQLINPTASRNNWPHWCKRCGLLLAEMVLALAWLTLAPTARAQDPCREGCDFVPGNTYLGVNALVSNTTGSGNTAAGALALVDNTSGSSNTAIGDGGLGSNTTGSANTATGYGALTTNNGSNNTATGLNALSFNTTGNDNTANGSFALWYNDTGSRNVATGDSALLRNQTGGDNTATGVNALYNNTASYNTATGYQALESNTTGTNNTASGLNALNLNTTGNSNAANGAYALYNNRGASNNSAQGYKSLYSNSSGIQNTADGEVALYKNTTGNNNSALGVFALYNNTTGTGNIALGYQAGTQLTTGSNNIDIGNLGVAGESGTSRIGKTGVQTSTYIAGISGVTVAGGVGVIIDTNGHLGTVVSSKRFKENVRPMEKESEALLSLRPVTFRYKHELDPADIPQFGLVAEDVAKVNPDLVARDEEGKPYTVRYEAVNAMLLNEFLKAHRQLGEQQGEIEGLKAALKDQAAQIQKVTAQFGTNNPAAQLSVSEK